MNSLELGKGLPVRHALSSRLASAVSASWYVTENSAYSSSVRDRVATSRVRRPVCAGNDPAQPASAKAEAAFVCPGDLLSTTRSE